jgi:hypothetical protein
MKLLVKSTYRAADVQLDAGKEIDVDEDRGRWLMRDAPGCFEEIKPRRSLRKPPRDKAISEVTEK